MQLTPREHDVLALIATGLTDGEIAETLGIARRTASNRVSTILLKLDARSRTEAVVKAMRNGILRDAPEG
jgi:DNA-binding NarL/FixJ family response regulator